LRAFLSPLVRWVDAPQINFREYVWGSLVRLQGVSAGCPRTVRPVAVLPDGTLEPIERVVSVKIDRDVERDGFRHYLLTITVRVYEEEKGEGSKAVADRGQDREAG
jgi:hypothetical protein